MPLKKVSIVTNSLLTLKRVNNVIGVALMAAAVKVKKKGEVESG